MRQVRLDNPLKQGLKPIRDYGVDNVQNVRLDNPLKQGLKLGLGCRQELLGGSAWTIH